MKEFKVLVEKSVENGQYVGLGNPNSKILFIGKEAGIDPSVKSTLLCHPDEGRVCQQKLYTRDSSSRQNDKYPLFDG